MQAITRLCPRAILLDKGEVISDGPSHEVVSSYIGFGEKIRAQKEWPDLENAPGDDVVRLAAVRARGKEGLVSDSVYIHLPLCLEMEYEVLKPNYVFLLSFHVMTETGIEAFNPIDNDPEWRDKPRSKGRYVSRAWVPGNFLSEGIHFVGASIRTLSPMLRHCSAKDHIAFQAVENMDVDSARVGWGGEINAVVRPLLEWETQFIPKGDKPAASVNYDE
jgi:lipopolysaccharide transport system ATP-binding protein